MSSNREFVLVLGEIAANLERAIESLDERSLDSIIQLVLSAKRVFVYGAGRSGYVARSFAQRLKQIGLEAYFVGESTTPACSAFDTLVVVSGSGQTPSVLAMLTSARNLGARTVLVTANRNGAAAGLAGCLLLVPGKTKLLETHSHAPFTSLFDVTSLSVLDGVTAELMQKMGVTEKDIQREHANLE
jgi:6-phospho-3-hexuloisomerase